MSAGVRPLYPFLVHRTSGLVHSWGCPCLRRVPVNRLLPVDRAAELGRDLLHLALCCCGPAPHFRRAAAVPIAGRDRGGDAA